MRKGRTLLKLLWPVLCLWWAASFAAGGVSAWLKYSSAARDPKVFPEVYQGFIATMALLALALGWVGVRRTRDVVREARNPQTKYPYLPVGPATRWLALAFGAAHTIVVSAWLIRGLVVAKRVSEHPFSEAVRLTLQFAAVGLPSGIVLLLVAKTGRVTSFDQRSATRVILVLEAIFLLSCASTLLPGHSPDDMTAIPTAMLLGICAILWTAAQR